MSTSIVNLCRNALGAGGRVFESLHPDKIKKEKPLALQVAFLFH